MPALLQDVHDVKLVFREDLGEAVGLLNGRRLRSRRLLLDVTQPAASRIPTPIPSVLAVS